MKDVKLNEVNYKVIKDYRDGFDKEAFSERYTDYFEPYDYILGDWSYGKLRLKGFYKKENKNVRELNNYDNLDKYLKTNCAYEAKHFVVEKVIE